MCRIIHCRISILLLAVASIAAAPVRASPFLYRGSLTDRGEPAQGQYGFRLSFYDAQSTGRLVAPAITLDGVNVSDGAFSTEVDIDQTLKTHATLWLEVQVRDAQGLFVPLAERQLVQPNVIAALGCWDINGNSGTNPTTNFLGNIDSVALELRTNNQRGLRLQPSTAFTSVPSFVGGYSGNSIADAASGAAILGGGGLGISNRVWDDRAVVVGGHNNIVGSNDGDTTTSLGSIVAGGTDNTVTGTRSAVLGGFSNVASGNYSVAMGSAAEALHTRSFVWSDGFLAGSFSTTGPGQFLIHADGGVAINTQPADAALTIVNGPTISLPLLRLYNSAPDSSDGGTIRITENGAADSGGFVRYDALQNWFRIGTNNGAGDTNVMTLPRAGTGVGILRVPTTYALEVQGDASKSTGGSTWQTVSDARIKTDVRSIAGALDTILRLNPVSFRYTDAYLAHNAPVNGAAIQLGVLAQQFRDVFPDAVRTSNDYLPDAEHTEDNRVFNVDLHPAFVTGLAAIQELAMNSQAQAEQIGQLKADNAQLRERLERIEEFLAGQEPAARQ